MNQRIKKQYSLIHIERLSLGGDNPSPNGWWGIALIVAAGIANYFFG